MGWTALMLACSRGHFEIARWLMGLGANIDLQNNVSRALSFSLSFIYDLTNALFICIGGMECDGLCRMD